MSEVQPDALSHLVDRATRILADVAEDAGRLIRLLDPGDLDAHKVQGLEDVLWRWLLKQIASLEAEVARPTTAPLSLLLGGGPPRLFDREGLRTVHRLMLEALAEARTGRAIGVPNQPTTNGPDRPTTGGTIPPAPPAPPREQTSPVTRAIVFVFDRTKATLKRPLMREVLQAIPDTSKATLYRNPTFMTVWRLAEQLAMGHIPPGRKTEQGVEAEDEDDPIEDRLED